MQYFLSPLLPLPDPSLEHLAGQVKRIWYVIEASASAFPTPRHCS
jgi:hypothetical protein